MAFTATTIVSEIETPYNGELSEKANLQEAYNKLCNITTKDAMSVELGLKR